MRHNVTYEFRDDGDGNFRIEAWINTSKVGFALCDAEGTGIILDNLEVFDEVHRNWPIFPWLLMRIGRKRSPMRPRGHGIGRGLLHHVLDHADRMGFQTVSGNITDHDLAKTPHLLNMYERAGFLLLDPDESCAPGTVKRIIRRRP